MKALICQARGQLSYQESNIPEIYRGYSLLKVKRIGICGTDLHAFEGTQPILTTQEYQDVSYRQNL